MTPPDLRQAMGCGFELPTPGARPWKHSGCPDAPTVCPGYTTKLPEVNEIARARMHAKNGMARDYLGGPATEQILRGIEILESSDSEATWWRPPEERK